MNISSDGRYTLLTGSFDLDDLPGPYESQPGMGNPEAELSIVRTSKLAMS